MLLALASAAPAETVLPVTRPWFGLAQVPVTLNGRVEGSFVVDSAASETVLGDAMIARLGLGPGESSQINGSTGSAPLRRYRLARLALGDRLYGDIGAYGFPPLAAPVEADGLIGADILRHSVVEFDLAQSRIVLYDRNDPVLAASGDWDAVPVFQRRDGFLIVEIAIGRRRIPALIDTGAVHNFANQAAARALGLHFVPGSASLAPITGASGDVQQMNALELSGFRIGDTDFGASQLGVVDLKIFDSLGFRGRPAMLLSLAALGGHRFVLDYPRSRLLIER